MNPRLPPATAAMIGACACFALMLFAVLAVGGCLRSRDPLAGVTPDQQVRINTPDGRERPELDLLRSGGIAQIFLTLVLTRRNPITGCGLRHGG